MNLYKITFSHTGPKSQKQGIQCYLLAENDEQVYNYIDEKFNDGCWKDMDEDEDGSPIELYDEDGNLVGTETFKQKILRINGEQNDEDYDYSDAYYGITLYGWELIKENIHSDYSQMIDLGIFHQTK